MNGLNVLTQSSYISTTLRLDFSTSQLQEQLEMKKWWDVYTNYANLFSITPLDRMGVVLDCLSGVNVQTVKRDC